MADPKSRQEVKKTPGTKPAKDERRVRRQHQWKHGHDPNDPDAEEGSGWEYVNLQPLETDTRIKTTRDMLSGGVESGLPCACGAMTRWVQTVSALKILEEGGFNVTSPEQRKRFAKEEVAILVCPACEAITQAQPAAIRALRSRLVIASS